MITYGDWFTGFGGASIGAKAAGLDIVFGAEYREDVANVYRQNLGDHIRVCDLTAVQPESFPYVDIFHASPPCPNFSTAKANAEETENDLALASAVAGYIAHHRPLVFTLENVYQYHNSQSWGMIAQALLTHGYQFNYWHVNTADYGVPQTRKRMIVIARRDGIRPMLPPGTHAENPQAGFFGTLKPWVGWYEAIEDLIPSLPDSQFADWQLARLPDEIMTCYINPNRNSFSDGWLSDKDVASHDRPAFSITAQKDESNHRAFIIDGQNGGRDLTILKNDNPICALTAQNKGTYRAFVCAQGKFGDDMPIYTKDEPHGTITANSNQTSITGYANGRIVKMTPRALARFQSFPDWYKLPASNKLAAYGIGNAVPPLFAEKLYKSILETLA